MSGGDCRVGLTCVSAHCVNLDPSTTIGSGGAGVAGASGQGGGGAGGEKVEGAGMGGGGGSGGSAGRGGGGVGGGSSGTQTLGGSCKADGDCVQGLGCIKPTDKIGVTSGGIGNGLCTRDCTLDINGCGANGSCVTLDVTASGSPKMVCLEKCAIGPNVAKCHGRQDVACGPLDRNDTVFGCIPLCVTDADCAGRRCDPSTGSCVDVPSTGKLLGSGCTVIAGQSNDECAGGVCLPIQASPPDGGPNPGVCSALCRFGTATACGFRSTPLGAGPPAGACAVPYDEGYDKGDLGLCLQLCDAPSDCLYHAPNWTCRTDIVVGGHSVCLLPDLARLNLTREGDEPR